MSNLNEKLRLIREGVILEENIQPSADITPLSIHEAVRDIDNITGSFMIEVETPGGNWKAKVEKFFEWIVKKINSFIEYIRKLFKSKHSLYTKIILKNKKTILNYKGDSKITILSNVLEPKMNLSGVVDHAKDLISKAKNMVVVESKYNGISTEELTDILIEEIYNVKDFSGKVGEGEKLRVVSKAVFGEPREVYIKDLNKKKVIERLTEFEKYDNQFNDLYSTLQKTMKDLQEKIEDEGEDSLTNGGDVKKLMDSTMALAKATIEALYITTQVIEIGYDSVKNICERIIYLSNKDDIE